MSAMCHCTWGMPLPHRVRGQEAKMTGGVKVCAQQDNCSQKAEDLLLAKKWFV